MDNTVFNFLHNKDEFNPKLSKLSFTQTSIKTPPNKKIDDRKNRGIFLKSLYKDTKSINQLEKIIKEILTFHKDFIPSSLPPRIDIEFLRTNKISQAIHSNRDRKDRYPYANANGTKIRIATDFVKEFDYHTFSLDKNFIDVLRNEISTTIEQRYNKNHTQEEKQKNLGKVIAIITELTFLHELGHIIFAQKVDGTLLREAIRKNEKLPKDSPIQQIARNASEGFADLFAIYLTQKHYLNEEIIDKYKVVRKKALKGNDGIIIHPYDIISNFDRVKGIKEKDIDKLTSIFLEISIDNALTIVKNKAENIKGFESILKEDLLYYTTNSNIKINENNNVVLELRNALKNKTFQKNQVEDREKDNIWGRIFSIRKSTSPEKKSDNNFKYK